MAINVVHCHECTFWSGDAGGWGTCERMSSTAGAPDYPDSLAHAQDGESYYAWGMTRFDFGCVMGQDKTAIQEKE